MSASNREEVTTLTKSRLIYLLLIASFCAYFLACMRIPGMSDGGGL
jgi:heme O synthase-like polyprenyltransferase